MTEQHTQSGPSRDLAAPPRSLPIAVILIALWILALYGLAPLFEPGPWLWRAALIIGAVIVVSSVQRARGSLHTAAWLSGSFAGLALWVSFIWVSERRLLWLQHPIETAGEVAAFAINEVAPIQPQGFFEDALLFGVFLLVSLGTLLMLGGGKLPASPVASGAVPALTLLLVPAITGASPEWWSLLGAGVMLAALVWLATSRLTRGGFVAAMIAVAVAAGVVTLAPDPRDRVWNNQILPDTFSVTVPDVTISLAEDLRKRSTTRAFRYTAIPPGAYRFTLVTLTDFKGGTWLPQDEFTADRINVTEARSAISTPTNEINRLELPMILGVQPPGSVAITIEGLRSPWLPVPQGTSLVLPVEGNRFDPSQWLWTADANTARAENTITRAGDSYLASVDMLNGESLAYFYEMQEQFQPGSFAGNEETFAVYPDPTTAPEELSPYLALPEGVPTSIATAAEQAARGADDRLTIGLELERWFRGSGFVYDESAPYSPGKDPENPYEIMEGLLDERSGFCVHYASTFAVMARHLGVPTRIALGYAVQAPRSQGIVRGGDLHAWPEIFVDSLGWVSFEPTPGGAGVRADTFVDVPATPEEQASDAAIENNPREQESIAARPDTDPTESEQSGTDAQSTDALSPVAWLPGVVTTVLLLLIFASPAAIRRIRSLRRRAAILHGNQAAQQAWLEFHDTVRDLRYLVPEGSKENATPLLRAKTAEALVEFLTKREILEGAPAEAAAHLARSTSAERYGSPQESHQNSSLNEALDSAISGLRSKASPRARMRARVLPPSVFLRLSQRRGSSE